VREVWEYYVTGVDLSAINPLRSIQIFHIFEFFMRVRLFMCVSGFERSYDIISIIIIINLKNLKFTLNVRTIITLRKQQTLFLHDFVAISAR